MVQYCLLRNGEQGVEIALLRHERIEAAPLGYSAVFQHYYAIVAAQLRFLKRMTTMRVTPSRSSISHAT